MPVLERMHDALNRHDLEAFVALFADDYESEQPGHPDRRFSGDAQVRENWSRLFASIPDLRAELIRSAVAGDTVWSEWHWTGTRTGGTPLNDRGVVIMGLRDDRIAWARLYMEPVEEAGAGIGAAVDRMATGAPEGSAG